MSRYVVGLTGGIGSGKSAVADAFARLGVSIVDTDVIAHQLTAPGGQAMPRLRDVFGEQVVRADGALDRVAMRRLVFADETAKAQLEGILHPLIREVSARQCGEAVSPYVILAVPLLVESGAYRTRCDRILVVDCPEELQVARVKARSGLSSSEVQAIMAAQASRAERVAVADDILKNDGDFSAMDRQVAELHRRYLDAAGKKLQANS